MLHVPVLTRFFNDEDTWPDSSLSRVVLVVLLDILEQKWNSGTSYRAVSRAFGISHSTANTIINKISEKKKSCGVPLG